MAKLVEFYVREIVKLHGVLSSIVSDRDPKFISHFLGVLHETLGRKLRLRSAYHPQTDGQTERTIQTLEDMLIACILDDRISWYNFLPLVDSPTTISIMQLLEWCHMRICIDAHVICFYDGTKTAKA